MHLPDGTTLQSGKYKIVRFISNGGFGCTYEGYHKLLEKRVAIKEFFVSEFCERDTDSLKVITTSKNKQPLVDRLRDKFFEEAKALFSLKYPGIVTVHDVFIENDTAFYVMEFIEGKSLADMINDAGPMAEQEAVGYIRQVAQALAHVHDNKMLHLDIKPANIMVDTKGRATLIDFGVAKQYDEVNGQNTSTLLGMTPGYAAPEQQANDVSLFMACTDIYALGATLYNLLTGVAPLSYSRVACGEQMQPLPANVTPATANAITKAMQPNRTKRPPTVHDFLKLLDGESSYTPATSQANDLVAPATPTPPAPPATPLAKPTNDDATKVTINRVPDNDEPSQSGLEKPKIKALKYGIIGLIALAVIVLIMVIPRKEISAEDLVITDDTSAEVTEQPELTEAEKNMNIGSEYIEQQICDNPSYAKTASGMAFKTIQEGSGDYVTADDNVVISYSGMLLNGTIFDSGDSVELNPNMVIPGLKEALMMMQEGGAYRVIIPGDLAYGEAGVPGKIAPMETLIFDVTVVKIK